MNVRRVVTAERGGRAVVSEDGIAPRAADFRHIPQMSQCLVWATEPGDGLAADGVDRTQDVASVVPPPGGTRFLFVRFPPDSVFTASDFDLEAAGAEQAEISPGLAELFEPDAPGKHRTATLDYVIVVEGELFLELDEEERKLSVGDVVIQSATRHSWSVRTERPATIGVVMVGVAD